MTKANPDEQSPPVPNTELYSTILISKKHDTKLVKSNASNLFSRVNVIPQAENASCEQRDMLCTFMGRNGSKSDLSIDNVSSKRNATNSLVNSHTVSETSGLSMRETEKEHITVRASSLQHQRLDNTRQAPVSASNLYSTVASDGCSRGQIIPNVVKGISGAATVTNSSDCRFL